MRAAVPVTLRETMIVGSPPARRTVSLPYRLIGLLADGRFHSGEALGAAVGMSRAGVWKSLRRLDEFGLVVCAVRGRGYRLAEPLELLREEEIRAALGPEGVARLARLEIHPVLDSTNRHLQDRARAGAPSGCACLAEMQRHGRGRHGRDWVSPFAANIYLSLLWRFAGGPAALKGLSLAAGVAGAAALADLGITGMGLKWPNDLVWNGRKLAGILIDLAGESAGPCYVVVGMGVNVAMPAAAGTAIDQPWVDLATMTGSRISRNRLAGHLLRHLVLALERFAAGGFAPFASQWRRLDVTAGRRVDLQLPDRTVSGVAEGVDSEGALLLRVEGRRRRFAAGELHLRVRA
ncbi:bifunctional ligase/repressor BirA [bacterium BMS3Abin12]|nr:bifunctional ligase/repressor BirA [bacterium BMS3Abin12]